MKRFRPLRQALLLAACAGVLAAGAADPSRGKALYESRCDSCHAESVHGRAKREATGYESLRGWVRRWSGNLGLKWTAEEIEDVTVWLNGRYYRFACPPEACRTTGEGPWRPQFTSAGSAGTS